LLETIKKEKIRVGVGLILRIPGGGAAGGVGTVNGGTVMWKKLCYSPVNYKRAGGQKKKKRGGGRGNGKRGNVLRALRFLGGSDRE